MYDGDSFYTLSSGGQAGLLLLSVLLGLFVLWCGKRLMRGRSLAAGTAVALVLLFAFVWLSPQVYYLYYLFLFEGLPWQSVVRRPPGPVTLLELLGFQGPATLSAHATGGLGWALIALAFLVRWRSRPSCDKREG